jgi:hypothetical protein
VKRVGGLWPSITDFGNLVDAFKRARLGKRFRPDVLAFQDDLEREMLAIQADLLGHSYVPRPYHQFWIQDPKRRLISAADFRDRVVQHALCARIGSVLERGLIHDCYANRVGFGSHRALRRFTDFLRGNRYVLQGDIRRYFPSMDHAVLKAMIRRRIKCPDTLWLLDVILDASPPQEDIGAILPGDGLAGSLERRRGLPIGNLVSQVLANVYLDGFDHFVKETLGIRHYLRYVDDFALFGDDLQVLKDALPRVRQHLATVGLVLNASKTRLAPTEEGACFVGFKVLPDRIRVRDGNLRRAKGRLVIYQRQFRQELLDLPSLLRRVRAWIAHLAQANTVRLRQKLFDGLVLVGPRTGGCAPRSARWQLEQQHQERAFRLSEQERCNQQEQQRWVPGGVCAGEHDPQSVFGPEFTAGMP